MILLCLVQVSWHSEYHFGEIWHLAVMYAVHVKNQCQSASATLSFKRGKSRLLIFNLCRMVVFTIPAGKASACTKQCLEITEQEGKKKNTQILYTKQALQIGDLELWWNSETLQGKTKWLWNTWCCGKYKKLCTASFRFSYLLKALPKRKWSHQHPTTPTPLPPQKSKTHSKQILRTNEKIYKKCNNYLENM